MDLERMEAQRCELVDDVVVGMRDWRAAHPRATFREIETALDERLQRVRARMLLEEAALASRAADWAEHAKERPRCPDCTETLQARGYQERGIKVQGDQEVRLRRRYGVCPACGAGVFPPGRGIGPASR